MNEIENNSTELENEGQQEKTYTEDEVREMLQRETDRRVSSALKKQEKDYFPKRNCKVIIHNISFPD